MSWIELWYVPLIAAGIGFHLAVTWILLVRYGQHRDRTTLWWAGGWVLLTIQVGAMLLNHLLRHANAFLLPAMAALEHLSYVAAAFAFMAGPGQRPWPRPVAWLPVAAALLALAGALTGIWYLGALPAAVAAALCFGLAARRAVPPSDQPLLAVDKLLVAGFLFGALRALSYPFAPTAWWKPGLEILTAAGFSLVFAGAVTLRALLDAREVEHFGRLAGALTKPQGTQEILEAALDVTMPMVEAPYGWVLLRTNPENGGGGPWTMAAARGFPQWVDACPYARAFPINECLCLRAVSAQQLRAAVNVVDCARMVIDQRRRGAGRHAAVPLVQGGRLAGILNLVLPGGRPLSPQSLQLLTAMGEQIGVALDRARLYDQLREKEAARGELLAKLMTAQEEERRRIARELHDEVGQTLNAIILHIDLITGQSPDLPAEAARRLATLKELTDATLADLRRVIMDLRPTMLDDLGLQAALGWLNSRYIRPLGMTANLSTTGLNQRLPQALETAVFRLVQEASTNAIKHSGGHHLEISVERDAEGVVVTVADDGRGLPPGFAARASMGLVGLSERIAQVGGRLEVESGPNRGTRIRAVLPVPAGSDTLGA